MFGVWLAFRALGFGVVCGGWDQNLTYNRCCVVGGGWFGLWLYIWGYWERPSDRGLRGVNV